MVQQNRNIMTFMNVLAHASSLRRKRRGIYPQVIENQDEDQIDEIIDRMESLGTMELEQGFESEYSRSGLNAGKEVRVSFTSWLETKKQEVCHSEPVRDYLMGTRYDDKRRFLIALAVLLSAWLPTMCAVVGAELLFRLGLKNVCSRELPPPSSLAHDIQRSFVRANPTFPERSKGGNA